MINNWFVVFCPFVFSSNYSLSSIKISLSNLFVVKTVMFDFSKPYTNIYQFHKLCLGFNVLSVLIHFSLLAIRNELYRSIVIKWATRLQQYRCNINLVIMYSKWDKVVIAWDHRLTLTQSDRSLQTTRQQDQLCFTIHRDYQQTTFVFIEDAGYNR